MAFNRNVPGWFERPGIFLLLAASLLLLGIVSGWILSPDPRYPVAAAVLCIASWGHCIRRRRSLLSLCFASVSLLLTGAAAISLLLYPFHANSEVEPFSGRLCRIEGKIIGMPRGFRGGQSLKILCTRIQDGSKIIYVREAIRLWVYGASEGDFSPEDRVRAHLRLKRPRGRRFPGDWDRRISRAGEHIYLTASTEMGPRLIREGGKVPLKWQPVRLFSEKADAVISDMEQPADGVLQALLLGRRYRIAPMLEESFRRSGLSHILAVSGLHVGLVGVLFYSLVLMVMRRFQFLSRRMDVRRIAALMSIAPVMLYTMVTGSHPPAQRACIMATLLFLGVVIERSYDQISSLLLAALLILIASPPSAFTPSFQLSFLAAFAILLVLRRFPRLFERRSGGNMVDALSRNSLRYLLISAAAFLGTFPLAAYYFSSVAPVGVLASLLAIPLCAFIILPFGLAGGIAALFSPGLAGVIMMPAAWGSAALAALAQKLSSVVPLFTGFQLSPAQVAGLYLVFASGAFQRRKVGKVGLLVGIFFFACSSILPNIVYTFDGVRVTFLDVGQGDAALIELPKGRNILVDAGGRFETYDFGASRVLPFMRVRRIKSLEALIISHDHIDHAGGMASVIREIPCRKIFFPSRPDDRLLDIWGMSLEEVDYQIIKKGDHLDIGPYTLQFLSPPGGREQDDRNNRGEDVNDNSLVFCCRGPHGTLFFPGDAGVEVLDHLSRKNPSQLKSAVLKVPHHGSPSSKSRSFYDAVEPGVAVVPSSGSYITRLDPSVIEELSQRGAEVFITGDQGSVECFLKKGRVCVTTWSGKDENLSPHGFWHWFFRGF